MWNYYLLHVNIHSVSLSAKWIQLTKIVGLFGGEPTFSVLSATFLQVYKFRTRAWTEAGEGTDPERCWAMTASRPAHNDRTVGSHRVIKSLGNTSGMPPTRVLTTLETNRPTCVSQPHNVKVTQHPFNISFQPCLSMTKDWISIWKSTGLLWLKVFKSVSPLTTPNSNVRVLWTHQKYTSGQQMQNLNVVVGNSLMRHLPLCF